MAAFHHSYGILYLIAQKAHQGVMLRRRKREISRDNGKFLGILRRKNLYQVAMLRRRKRENSRENEENSVKTYELVQIEIFPNPENFPVFAVLIYPPV